MRGWSAAISGDSLLNELVAAAAVETGSGPHTPSALQGRTYQKYA